MKQVKEQFIRLKNEKGKARETIPSVPGFKEAATIAVLLNLNGEHTAVESEHFVEKLKEANKEVRFVAFVEKDTEDLPYEFFCEYIGYNDFNFFGSPQSTKLKSLINTAYDYLVCINERESEPVSYIIRNSNAKCRVSNGSYLPSEHTDLTVMPEAGSSFGETVAHIENYLKKLS